MLQLSLLLINVFILIFVSATCHFNRYPRTIILFVLVCWFFIGDVGYLIPWWCFLHPSLLILLYHPLFLWYPLRHCRELCFCMSKGTGLTPWWLPIILRWYMNHGVVLHLQHHLIWLWFWCWYFEQTSCNGSDSSGAVHCQEIVVSRWR